MTCLPLVRKLLSGVIADQIYGHLDQQKLLPEEQQGCKKISRETIEELLFYFILVDSNWRSQV